MYDACSQSIPYPLSLSLSLYLSISLSLSLSLSLSYHQGTCHMAPFMRWWLISLAVCRKTPPSLVESPSARPVLCWPASLPAASTCPWLPKRESGDYDSGSKKERVAREKERERVCVCVCVCVRMCVDGCESEREKSREREREREIWKNGKVVFM